MSSPRHPSPAQYLGYVALGRPLPHELRDWVRQDLAGPRAALRHVLRTELLYLPVFVAFLLFPGPLWVRGLMMLMGLLLSTFYTVAFMAQNRYRRLELNGLPVELETDHAQHVHDVDRAAYERQYRTDRP